MAAPAVLAPARPRVLLRGTDSPALAEGLTALRIHEDRAGLFSCEATFGNWGLRDGKLGYLYFGRDQLDFGVAFAVRLDGSTLFAGRIMGLEAEFPDGAPPKVTVLAEDRFQDLRMTRRTRSFADTTDEAVLQRIASDHSLTPSVDVSGPKHAVLAQVNQSDLAFLRDRARALDAELWLDGTTLHVAQHTRRRGPSVRLAYGRGLVRFAVLADLARQRSSVTVTGWDVTGKKALAEKADDAALGGEISGGDSGASVLSAALAARAETVAHAVPIAGAEAKARAEAIFRRGARQFVRGHGVAITEPDLRVGAKVELTGLGPLFSGSYHLTDVVHRFDAAEGLRSEITVERPVLGRRT